MEKPMRRAEDGDWCMLQKRGCGDGQWLARRSKVAGVGRGGGGRRPARHGTGMPSRRAHRAATAGTTVQVRVVPGPRRQHGVLARHGTIRRLCLVVPCPIVLMSCRPSDHL